MRQEPTFCEIVYDLELSETNGIYGYRSHNFNIIPSELDSTGKKIEINTSLDSFKLHIVLDKSSDITTISCCITIITAKWMVCMYSVHGISLSDDDDN
jgi:hypothetical protein